MEAFTKLSSEEILRIYNEDYIGKHLGGYTLEKIYGYKFYNSFKKLGLKMRDNHEKGKKYHCNSDFFKDIDNEIKAYWFGFIYADGFLTTNEYNTIKLGISLNENDHKHLEKFKNDIEFNGSINVYKVKQGYKPGIEYCRIIIADKKIVDDLMSHGLVEHKSNIMEPPKDLPDSLIRHFIRGFMEANGSIIISNNKDNSDLPSYGISFCSTESVLNWIQNFLLENKLIEHLYPLRKRKENHIVKQLTIGGNRQVKKILDYIYKDASIWLDRKYERYQSLCALIEKIDDNVKTNKCAYCGTTTSYEFDKWTHGGEYDGKVLCRKHYNHLKKYGYMIPEKKDKCDICGSSHGGLIRVGSKWGQEYHGKTLCISHYNQLLYYGEIKNNSSWEERHGYKFTYKTDSSNS